MVEENILFENTEIDDSMHMMCAEGSCDEEPTEQEVERFLAKNRWCVDGEIDIHEDDFNCCWRWSCKIKRGF